MSTKKGSLYDVIFLLAATFVILIAAIFTYYIVNEVQNDVGVQAEFNRTGTSLTYFDQGKTALNAFDYGVATFIFITGLATIALATMINSNPVFFFGSFIVLIVIVGVSAILANTAIEIVSVDALSATVAQFPISMLVLSFYPHICLIISALVAIVQYSKTSSITSGGYAP
jgi:hypothetical protein